MISWSAVSNVILAELNQDRHPAAATSTADAFVRGANGNLWHFGPSGWEDTRLAMVGAPAAVGGSGAPINVFYRDTSNRLTRAFVATSGWTSATIGGAIINDPVAASTGPGQFDVVALGIDYTPSHWWWNGSGVSVEHLASQRGLGQPALIAAPGRLDVFMRGFDRAVHHIRKTGSGVVNELLGGIASDTPSAVATTGTAGTTRRVFVHGQDNRIWAASSLNDGGWKWAQLPPLGTGDRFAGSPSASTVGSTLYVQTRTGAGTLGRLRFNSAGWTYTNLGGAIVDSPTSVGNTAYAHGRDGTLQFFDGTKWISKGGRFD